MLSHSFSLLYIVKTYNKRCSPQKCTLLKSTTTMAAGELCPGLSAVSAQRPTVLLDPNQFRYGQLSTVTPSPLAHPKPSSRWKGGLALYSYELYLRTFDSTCLSQPSILLLNVNIKVGAKLSETLDIKNWSDSNKLQPNIIMRLNLISVVCDV